MHNLSHAVIANPIRSSQSPNSSRYIQTVPLIKNLIMQQLKMTNVHLVQRCMNTHTAKHTTEEH